MKITDAAGRLRMLEEIETDVIRAAMKRYKSKAKAAQMLGISRGTLYRKLGAW